MFIMNNRFLFYRNVITCHDMINNDYDDNLDNCHYVLNIEETCDKTQYISSLSNQTISIYDKVALNIVNQINNVHNDCINVIETSLYNPNIFYSGSADKTIGLWDCRQSSSPIARISFPDDVMALSVGMNDTLLAAGYGNTISFIDIRSLSSSSSTSSNSNSTPINYNRIKLGSYSDVHTDIITQLKFLKSNPSILMSAADDGLICVYDTSVSQQESAVQSILNTECPVRRFGFFGSQNEGLFCLSTIETLSVWHYPSALRIGNYANIREFLNVDYLVDCYYDANNDSLNLISGKYDGTGIIVKVEPNSLNVESTLLSGHSAQIRCANVSTLPSSSNNIITTGGEDSKICTWVSSSVINNEDTSQKPSSSPSKEQRRNKPY